MWMGRWCREKIEGMRFNERRVIGIFAQEEDHAPGRHPILGTTSAGKGGSRLTRDETGKAAST